MIPRFYSLRTQIFAWSFVPTALIMLAVALVAFSAYRQVTSDLVMEQNQEVTRLAASQVATEMAEHTGNLEALARALGATMPDVPGLRRTLTDFANRTVVYDGGIVVLDNHGFVVGAQPQRLDILAHDWSDREYFRNMVRSPGPLLSNIAYDGVSNEPVIVASVPIIGAGGEFLGVLCGMFKLGASSLSSFYGSIVKLRIDEGGDTYVVDGSGRIIYHVDAVRIGSSAMTRPAAREVLAGRTGAFRAKDGEKPIVASFAPVPGTPWGLVTETDWEALLRPSESYRRFLILLLALGVIVPAVVVAFGVGNITKPIRNLVHAAQAVAGGKFGQTIADVRIDELRELVSQFNSMSAQLSESYTALQKQNEQLELVMEGTNDGIWDWDIRAGRVYFSPRWKSMVGYADDEIKNDFQSWLDLIHPADIDHVQEQLHTYLEGRSPVYQVEHRLRHKDGSYRWILSRGSALRDPDGTPYRLTGSHTDVTERRQATEAVELANQTLERRVEERTRDLSTLNTIASVVSRSLNLEDILSDSLDECMHAMSMEIGTAFVLDADADSFHLKAARGASADFTGKLSVVPVAVAMAGREFNDQTPLEWQIHEYPEGEVRQSFVQEGIRFFIATPLTAKDRLIGALVLCTRLERIASPEEASLLMAIGRQIGVAVENAGLYETEQGRHDEAERRRVVAEGLREILAVLNSRATLQETLQFITQQACHVMGSDGAAILRLQEPEHFLRIQAAHGMDRELVEKLVMPVGAGGAGLALRDSKPVAISDTRIALKQMQAEGLFPPEVPPELLERVAVEFRSLLSVPFIVKDQPYGAISLYFKLERRFSDEDVRLAQSVAHQAALATESARLREQAEQSAAIAERNRLARELHDSVTQNLYSITLYAEAAARLSDNGDSAQAAGHLRELRDTSQEALREMRLLIFELRPPELEKTGLAGALQTRLQSVEARGGLQADFHSDGLDQEPQVSMEVQEELYHIAQEALNNSLKHARAKRVSVSLKYSDQRVHLDVRDDGSGFEPCVVEPCGGQGLRNMRERTARLGGVISIDTALGKGTRVQVDVPAAPNLA